MNSILKFLVPVCCIALSSAVEVEIPVSPALKFDVPLTPAQVTSCSTEIKSFQDQYAGSTASTKCVTDLAATQWSNFKLGFSDVKIGSNARDFGTSHADCKLKDSGTALQIAYCDHINKVATQCRCDTTTCITGDIVGTIAAAKKTACYGVPTTMCEATQTAMSTPCQTAVSSAVASPIPNTTPYDKTKVVLKCAKEDCPPNAVEVEIPGTTPTLKFNVPITPAEATSCDAEIVSFKTQYTTSAKCVTTLATTQWNNFKLGFSAVKVSGNTDRDFGTSYADCKTKDSASAIQLAYCEYINKVATQCRCDTTTCIAGDLVDKVTTDKKTACYGVPTTMCESTQTAMKTPCDAAVAAAVADPIPSSTPYDKTKIALKCAEGDCPKKPQADAATTAAPPKASGAIGLAAMVAVVTMITTMIIA